MIHIISRLKLESYDKWKPIFNERAALRKDAGSQEAILFRNSNDPHEVLILFKWDTLERAKEYLESALLERALEKAGGKIIEIIYLDKIVKST
jgi:heme-degrading monooxygenase HmoA